MYLVTEARRTLGKVQLQYFDGTAADALVVQSDTDMRSVALKHQASSAFGMRN